MPQDDSTTPPDGEDRPEPGPMPEHPAIDIVRDLAVSVAFVAIVGLLLVGVSGVWPPLVAVESGSMEPHLSEGDLVLIVDERRLRPEPATGGAGVVTYRTAASRGQYQTFGTYGDVIVFETEVNGATSIIHRAHFWVNASENWYGKADPAYLDGESCAAISNCPAPHAGFITKGDHNPRYDQVTGRTGPVRPASIRGTAEARVPLLGYVRLAFSEVGL